MNIKMRKSMHVGEGRTKVNYIHIYECMWECVQQRYDYNVGVYDCREKKISWANQVSIAGWVDGRLEVVELIRRRFLFINKASTSLLKEQMLLSFRDIYKRSFYLKRIICRLMSVLVIYCR